MPYLAFGTSIAADYHLEGLPQNMGTDHEVAFNLYRTRDLHPIYFPCVGITHAQYRSIYYYYGAAVLFLQVDGFIRFSIPLGSSQKITCLAQESASQSAIQYWFLQKAYPLYLLVNSFYELLHAAVVDTQYGAIAFLGKSGIGKSTMLDYFLSQGHSMISDEYLALSDKNILQVAPTIPYCRSFRKAECLGKHTENFCGSKRHLSRIYFLQAASTDAAPETKRMNSSEIIQPLISNQQFSLINPRVPHFHQLASRRLIRIIQLAKEVSMKRLIVPRSLPRLPEVYETVMQDLNSATTGA